MVQRMNKHEAIERLKEHVSAIMLYVTEAKLNKEEVENELLNIEALKMAIEALQSERPIEGRCGNCAHKDKPSYEEPCHTCLNLRFLNE